VQLSAYPSLSVADVPFLTLQLTELANLAEDPDFLANFRPLVHAVRLNTTESGILRATGSSNYSVTVRLPESYACRRYRVEVRHLQRQSLLLESTIAVSGKPSIPTLHAVRQLERSV
jgi:hypothetical protein